MRRNGALAADYARRHGVPRWYDDAEALDRRPGRWTRSTSRRRPTRTRSYALAVAAAGKPAYVEKPMARHAPECDRMVERSSGRACRSSWPTIAGACPCFVKVRGAPGPGAVGRLTGCHLRLAEPHHLKGSDVAHRRRRRGRRPFPRRRAPTPSTSLIFFSGRWGTCRALRQHGVRLRGRGQRGAHARAAGAQGLDVVEFRERYATTRCASRGRMGRSHFRCSRPRR